MNFKTSLKVLLTALLAGGGTEAFSGVTSGSPPGSRVASRSFGVGRSSRYHRVSSASSSSRLSAHVGIVGATGAVGTEIVGCLENRNFPVDRLRIFGSPRSAGSVVKTKFGDVTVELYDTAVAQECDVVFLAVDGDFALKNAPSLAEKCVVIDNSSAFRYDPDVPLVVPEINGDKTKGKKLIANPNCTTAIGLMALYPILKLFGLKRVIMSTYQAASGAGAPGMEELKEGTIDVVTGKKDVADNSVFAHPLPFNVIPHIDKFQENGYTKEEMKVTWETRKICDLPDDFPVSCTAVRIPTYRAHSETIVVETETPVDIELTRQTLAAAPGVKLVDDILSDPPTYPMPLTATGQYDIEVGRIRRSEAFGDNGLEFFVSGDQLLRGAALNAVIVAEEMVKNGSI